MSINDRMRTPVATSDGTVGLGTVLIRHQGQVRLVVVAKASFALVDGGVARYTGPGVVAAEDRTLGRNPARSLELSTDLVPFRPRCDVTLVGHCHSPQRTPVPAMLVRLGLERDGQALLDKRIVVIGKRSGQGSPQPFTTMRICYENAIGGPGEANPVGGRAATLFDRREPSRATAFGPVSPFWRARKQLLGTLEPMQVNGSELPDTIPWAYFQAAPPDQQIDPLQGGETLLLDGFDPVLPHQTTELPRIRPSVRALVPGRGLVPVDLVCDTLAINTDTRSFDLVWRGHVAVDPTHSPLIVAACYPHTGTEPDWEPMLAAALPGAIASMPIAPPKPVPLPTAAASPPAGEQTHALRAEDHEVARQIPSAPFVIPEPRGGPRAPAAPGLPWSPGPSIGSVQPAALVGEETIAQTPVRKADTPHANADLLKERLLSSGMDAEEVAALLSALKPNR